jgi:hypothetical protein
MDNDDRIREEIQIQATCHNGCPYNGSRDQAEDAYPKHKHPGNWKHIGRPRNAVRLDGHNTDSESEEENVSNDSEEPGRNQLKVFRKSTVSLPLMVGGKKSDYVSQCTSLVMSIDEALRTGPNRNSHLTETERATKDSAARMHMHQKRINSAQLDNTYERLYSADAVAHVNRRLGTIQGSDDEREANALPAEESEDEGGSLGSANSTTDSIPSYVSNSSRAAGSKTAIEEPDLPTEIAIENQRRGISEYPQLGSHQVGNCHISNSTLIGTKKILVEGEPNCWTHFVLKKEKLIDGVNMYTGFLRNYWQKKSLPHFFKALPNMVSYAEAILAGDTALDPELLLVANSTRHQTAESVYGKRAEGLMETMRGCTQLVDDISGSLLNSDRHGVRLELTFTFNKIQEDTSLSWPLPRNPANTLRWFRIAKTTDLMEFFKMFKNRQVTPLTKLFTNDSCLMRAHLLSPPAKTAIVFLVECLVKVLDANGFRGPITEAFLTNLNLTIPDEALVPVTEFDRDLTGLEYGVHPMFLRCTRVTEFKVSRPPGFAVPSAQWLAAPLSKFVHWPNRYLYHANRINALFKSFYSAIQELKNSDPEGRPPTNDQIVTYVHDRKGLCPKFISVKLIELVQMPRKSQEAMMGLIAEEINKMYNDIWTGRIRSVLQRRNQRQSFNRLTIPDKACQFQFLGGDKKDFLRLADSSNDNDPRSKQGVLERSSDVMMEAFCYPHTSGDQQWRKCPIRQLFTYTVSCLSSLREAAKNAPQPSPTGEPEDPPQLPNLFLTNPPELVIEYFVNSRTYTGPSRNKEGSIIWATTPEKMTKHMGLARNLATSIPAIQQQATYTPMRHGSTSAPRSQGQRPSKRQRTRQGNTHADEAPVSPGQQPHRSPHKRNQQAFSTRSPQRTTDHQGTTVDSSLHQSIQNLATALTDKVGKAAVVKLQKNEFFSYTDRICEFKDGETGNAPVHEVVAIRALILAVLQHLTESEKTFNIAVGPTNKWVSCFKTIILHGQVQNSYLYATSQAITEKIKQLKKNYHMSQITTEEQLKEGAAGLRSSTVKTAIWQSATKSLLSTDLSPFFQTASARPFVSVEKQMTDPPENYYEPQSWEECIQEIARGNLYPQCMRKLVEGRTVYMVRQEEALISARGRPETIALATNYKTMWKSPDQPDADIDDLSTYPNKYHPPKIYL